MLAVVVCVVIAWLPLAALTAVGAARRGAGPALRVVEGVAFPMTWAAWYVRDDEFHAPR